MEADALVFIIDDDAQVRDSLANLCRSVNINVCIFGSTEEFARAERPVIPCCIVLDVRFPGSAPSGLDFQRGTDALASPPIIFITGHGDIKMSVQAMKLGAVEFLTKPVREQELLDAIRRGLELDLKLAWKHRSETSTTAALALISAAQYVLAAMKPAA